MNVVTNSRFLASCFVLFFFLLQPTTQTLAVVDPNKPVSDLFKQQEQQDEEKLKQQEQPPIKNEQKNAEQQLGPSAMEYVKTLFSLAFVIGLLVVILKYIQRRNRQYDRHRLLTNIGGLPLGQHKSIQLVKIADTYYVVGVGDDVRLLKEITNTDELRRIEEHLEEQRQDPLETPIGKLMQRFRNRKSNNSSVNEQPERFEHVFQSTLDEIKKERQQQLRRWTEEERNPNE